jgi:Zn-dependent protease with chaperone function
MLIAPDELGLEVWNRWSELSADRAALLVMQDERPFMSMLMKLASGPVRLAPQLDLDAFGHQADAYLDDAERSLGDRLYKMVSPAPIPRGSTARETA